MFTIKQRLTPPFVIAPTSTGLTILGMVANVLVMPNKRLAYLGAMSK